MEETENKEVKTATQWETALPLQQFNIALAGLLSQYNSTGWLIVIDDQMRQSWSSFTATSSDPGHGHLSSLDVCSVWGRPNDWWLLA